MRDIKFIVFLVVVFLLGCEKAEISFTSHADMKSHIKDATDLKWSIALSKDNITKVLSIQDIEYNMPCASKNELNKHLLFDWVKKGEEISVKIRPGVYDWLIVLDHDGDGKIDSHLGTIKSQIRLDQYEFVGGKHYKVMVHEDSNVSFVVE